MWDKSTHVLFNGLEREGVVDSELTSPLKSGFEFIDAIGRVPP